MIAVGIEPLFHRSCDATRPTIVYRGDPSMLAAEGNRLLDRPIVTAHSEIRDAFAAGCPAGALSKRRS